MTKSAFLACLTLSVVALIIYSMFFFLFLANNPCVLMYDSRHYHEGALALLQQGAYATAGGEPLFYRLPGYPFFLVILYWITNYSVQGALLLHIVFAATLPILIWLVVLRLTGQRQLAELTAWLSVCAPAFMIFSGLVMSEILSTWLFLLFFLCVLRALDDPNRLRFFIGGGVFLGLLSLVRPVGHLLVPFAVGFMVIFLRTGSGSVPHQAWDRDDKRRGTRRRKLLSIALFFGSWVIVIAPWVLRNFLLTGHLFFHTLSGPHFINHVALRLVAAGEQISYSEAKNRVYERLKDLEVENRDVLGRDLSEIELTNLYERETISIIKHYPAQFLQLAAINCFKTMFSLYSSELLVIDAGGALPSYDRTGLMVKIKRFLMPTVNNRLIICVIYLELVLLLLTIAGALLAVVRFWRMMFDARVILVLGVIDFFVGISFACGYARLRLAVEPFYLLAAAYAINELSLWYQRSVSGRLLSK